MADDNNYDFFKHYEFYENKQIIFSFNGKISNPALQGIISILEDKLKDYNVEKSCLRRIISIIIELTQNIQRYSDCKTSNQGEEYGHGILVVRKTEEGFRIHAGNLLKKEDGEQLAKYCNLFTQLSQESLKELYNKKLKVKRSTPSDSAGIGLLHILRKSDSHMEITSHPAGDSNVFLAFSILVA